MWQTTTLPRTYLTKPNSRPYTKCMSNPTLALAAYESLTVYSTSSRIMQTGYALLAAADEVHHTQKQKYIDRASVCFEKCGYRLPDNG